MKFADRFPAPLSGDFLGGYSRGREDAEQERLHNLGQLAGGHADTRGIQRIGLGYDVHAFAAPEDKRELILGGVKIHYERGLLGHSDADVLCHAIADALLGAARLGDIGAHFPDTDPAFKGASSLMLLKHVGELLCDKGMRIVDIDSVLVAQAPRISPFRDAMQQNIARVLDIGVSQVGVKATTTEHLGFEGRGEGISAQAVALIVIL